MKLSKLLRVSSLMSSSKPPASSLAESKIRELFGSSQPLSSGEQVVRADKLLLKRSKAVVEQSEKIRNYHNYEYYRGQDLIENIPYFQMNKYTVKDRDNELIDKERRAIEELQPIRNHIERAKLIRERIAAYHDKQRKYEIEEFERYLSEYPGTVRGPRPEDDWEAYRAYGLKKIPKIISDEISERRQIKNQMNEALNDEQDDIISTEPQIASPGSILSYFSKDRPLLKTADATEQAESKEEGEQKEADGDDSTQTYEKYINDYDAQMLDQFKTDVPMMPNSNFEGYQPFINHWMNWLNFRNSYIHYNLAANLEKLSQRLMRLTKSLDQDPENEYMDLPCNIPSLSRYYRCLPKQMQDHPGMKDIYLGLEYTAPDFSYEEKEEALNYTCRFLLPFDEISTKVMKEYTSRFRAYPTPYLFDKIFTISPEFTWDLNNFLEQIRRQELKGETSNQNKQLRFPEPPEVHKMWEQGCASLPVDFYDNDDGFWDSVISQKLRRYDAHRPMLKTRKYFTH